MGGEYIQIKSLNILSWSTLILVYFTWLQIMTFVINWFFSPNLPKIANPYKHPKVVWNLPASKDKNIWKGWHFILRWS